MPVECSFTSPNGDPETVLRNLLTNILPPAEQMMAAGNEQIERIKTRTRSGVDVDGQQFQPYTDKYAKRRQAKGLNTDPVDLTVSGQGLDSMRTEVRSETEFAIGYEDPSVSVYMEAQDSGNSRLPARHFFGTNDAELQQMGDVLFATRD